MNKIKVIFIILSFAGSCKLFIYGQNTSISQTDSLLKKVFALDQKYRILLDSLAQSGTVPDIELFYKIAKQDSVNQSITFPIVDKIIKGELGGLSDNSYRACYYVIQHSDGTSQLKYASFIKLLFNKKLISNEEYMWFTDRLHVRQHKAQVYGLQTRRFETGDLMLYPIYSGYRKAWAEIGEAFDKNIWASFTGDYHPVFIEEDEFVIIIHLKDPANNTKGLKNIDIRMNDITIGRTNDYGFFIKKIKKENIPDYLCFKSCDNEIKYPITVSEYEDFMHIVFVFQ